jgi:hypothetical protein
MIGNTISHCRIVPAQRGPEAASLAVGDAVRWRQCASRKSFERLHAAVWFTMFNRFNFWRRKIGRLGRFLCARQNPLSRWQLCPIRHDALSGIARQHYGWALVQSISMGAARGILRRGYCAEECIRRPAACAVRA